VASVVQLAVDTADDAHLDAILVAVVECKVSLIIKLLVSAVLKTVLRTVTAATAVVEDVTKVLVVEVPLGGDDACGYGDSLVDEVGGDIANAVQKFRVEANLGRVSSVRGWRSHLPPKVPPP